MRSQDFFTAQHCCRGPETPSLHREPAARQAGADRGINSAAGSGRKAGGPRWGWHPPPVPPPQQQPEHLQRLQGEEVPSAQLPPRRLCKITLSRSKAALRSRKKPKTKLLCAPPSLLCPDRVSSQWLWRESGLQTGRCCRSLQLTPQPAAGSSQVPALRFCPLQGLKGIWPLLGGEGELTRVCEAPDLLQ